MATTRLPAATKKCATCERWSGVRHAVEHGGEPGSSGAAQVEFDAAQAGGECIGGPWDGNVRDPLTRCGRWVQWLSPP